MKNSSSPELTNKKVKAGHKKHSNSRKTLNDNEIFRVVPDDGTFCPELTKKNEQDQIHPKDITVNKRKNKVNSFSVKIPEDHVLKPKFINKHESLNNSKTVYKKRDITECFPTTIIPDKKVKEAIKIPKGIKEDTRKNIKTKHTREEVVDKVVDKENLRKNKNTRYFREEDIHRNDVRKKFNSLIREDAKGDVKQSNKFFADPKMNNNTMNRPMGDVLKTNIKKFNREEKDLINRGAGDIGKQMKGIKLNENKKNDDKGIYSSTKEVPVVKPFLDILSKKKLINDKYTIRMKKGLTKDNTAGIGAKEINIDVEKTIEKATTKVETCELYEKSVQTDHKSVGTNSIKKPTKTDSSGQRRPFIKTVRVKNDNRVFKSVTFVDRKQPTPLLISIPTNYRKSQKKEHEHRHTVKHNTSKDTFVKNVKKENEKITKVKRRSRKRRPLSPDLITNGPSPPTEVAKWAPSCMNHHTKPYYEAWVDTTLASTTKCLKDDEFSYHRQDFVRAFKTALEKPMTEDILLDKIGDERYTGKIKVRHR